MLRQVRIEGADKSRAATLFGVSRPTFYQARGGLSTGQGLSGLLPKPRGPKGASQAHCRSDGVYRTADERGQTSSSARATRRADRSRARSLGPPPQHRTRLGAQKKTLDPTPPSLPAAAVSTLRGVALRGTCAGRHATRRYRRRRLPRPACRASLCCAQRQIAASSTCNHRRAPRSARYSRRSSVLAVYWPTWFCRLTRR